MELTAELNAAIDARLEQVMPAAEDTFWETIADGFRSATTGDLDPGAAMGLEQAMRDAAKAWIEYNVPTIVVESVYSGGPGGAWDTFRDEESAREYAVSLIREWPEIAGDTSSRAMWVTQNAVALIAYGANGASAIGWTVRIRPMTAEEFTDQNRVATKTEG